jgi:hypothetical protein
VNAVERGRCRQMWIATRQQTAWDNEVPASVDSISR